MSESRTGLPARLAALVTVLLVGLLTGCSAGSDESDDAAGPDDAAVSVTPSPSPVAPPVAQEPPGPRRGSCHRISFDDAIAPTTDPGSVPCAKPHTSQTFAVGTVANLVEGHLLAIDSARVQDEVARACPASLAGAVGGSADDVRLSMLRAIWFTPTVEESDAGADWFRCDVVALAGSDRLTEVRGSLLDVLATAEGRERFAMCGTARPDAADFERVPCARSHTWRAITVVELPDGPYPGREAITSAGDGPCRDAAAARAADPLDFEWGLEGPDPDQWAAGQTFVRCWVPD